MVQTWFSVLQLSAEAHEVIVLRMLKLAQGGERAFDEAFLMMVEKVDAGTGALAAFMAGASVHYVVAGYRHEVRANALRLARGG